MLVNNFQDFLKMRIAMNKDFSEKKENSKKTSDDLKKALNKLPLFKLPKHPLVDSKEKIKYFYLFLLKTITNVAKKSIANPKTTQGITIKNYLFYRKNFIQFF